jgi:hypothetical protein
LAPGLDNPNQHDSAHEIGFFAHADFRASWLMAQGAPRKNRTDLPVTGKSVRGEPQQAVKARRPFSTSP